MPRRKVKRKKIFKIFKIRRLPRLPKKLLFIPSSDKNFIEKWGSGRDPLNFPASFRMVIMGKPGCGKTCFIKNVCLRIRPRFEKIYVLHQDKYAHEYDDLDADVINELPPNDFWMGYREEGEEDEIEGEGEGEDEEPYRPKTLVIIDDICFKDLPKEQTMLLDRLCGMISSHYNVSLACLNQDVFAINPIIRKCANVWCIWRPSCTDELNTIARRCGYSSKDFKSLFDNIAKNENDSILVDQTPGTPYPLRLNGYDEIERE